MEIHPLEICVPRMKECSVVTDSVQGDTVVETEVCIATLINRSSCNMQRQVNNQE